VHENITIDAGDIAPADTVRKIRRLVTAVDADGRSYIAQDEASPHVRVIASTPTFVISELWRADAIPVDNTGPIDDGLSHIELSPPSEGAIFRTVEFPPDSHWLENPAAPPDQVHTTASIDFAIVISGSIWAVTDNDERLMGPGDVLIQRGTRHSWSNRGTESAIVAFVLVAGTTATQP
jgi:hypothetical protein